jgi:GntR family transcriptional regulator / MocR family aminotransferase
MARARSGLPLASLWLDVTSKVPLYQQLYVCLKRAILHGQLQPGSRLPSTRTIATDLRFSRNTVTVAFEQLFAEGYIEARIGSGTRVVSSLPNEFLRPPPTSALQPRLEPESRLSQWAIATQKLGAEFQRIGAPSPTIEPRPFQSGVPAVDQFPAELWARHYASAARAVRCDPEQVIIVAGSQQGLYLAARLLADAGDPVWIEDPGFPGARNTFQSVGLKVVPVAIDGEGLTVTSGARSRARPRLIYVTPSHQFPLGTTMTLTRRLALLELAVRSGAWILEDDYDSEYRYTGRPIPSLQGLTEDNRVIYCVFRST